MFKLLRERTPALVLSPSRSPLERLTRERLCELNYCYIDRAKHEELKKTQNVKKKKKKDIAATFEIQAREEGGRVELKQTIFFPKSN